MPLFHILKCAGPLLKWFTCLITELGSHWGISGGRRGSWKETALGPAVCVSNTKKGWSRGGAADS